MLTLSLNVFYLFLLLIPEDKIDIVDTAWVVDMPRIQNDIQGTLQALFHLVAVTCKYSVKRAWKFSNLI